MLQSNVIVTAASSISISPTYVPSPFVIFKPEVSEPPCTKINSPTDEIVPEFIIVKLSHVAVPSPTLIP